MNDLIDRLRDADPATGLAAYDEVTVRRNLDALTSAERPTRRVPRWALAAAATIAVAALGLGQVLTAPPPMAAAEVLNATASAVPADPPARGDQYWKVTQHGHQRMPVSHVTSSGEGPEQPGVEVQSVWWAEYLWIDYVAVDGQRPNWTDQTFTNATLITGPDHATFPNTDSAYTMNLTDSDLPPEYLTPTPAFLATLPQDTDTLIAALRAEAERSAAGPEGADRRVFELARHILMSGRATGELTAALLRALATLPELEVEQDVSILSSTGVAVTHTGPEGMASQLVVDPERGKVLGERVLATRDVGGPDAFAGQHLSAGDVLSEALVTQDLVDAVPQSLVDRADHLTCRVTADVGVVCDEPRR
ncbi:MAG: hypothetical protein Q4F65_04670 [Propionibacteriaceae bacterium]|nr:hypothetical protein [Propionibacteriaceae bacterium]